MHRNECEETEEGRTTEGYTRYTQREGVRKGETKERHTERRTEGRGKLNLKKKSGIRSMDLRRSDGG